jgi:hypothetical protein
MSAGKLRVVADDARVPPLMRYRAAGFVEGWLTAPRIWQHFKNMKHYFEQNLYPGVDIWGPPMQWYVCPQVYGGVCFFRVHPGIALC